MKKCLFFLALITINGLLAQTISTVSTYHNIGISLSFSIAPEPGTTAILYVKKQKATNYMLAHPLVRISNTVYAGSIVQLEENTAYDIKITSTHFADVITTATTKNSIYTQSNTVIYYVDSATGNDNNAGTTITAAFRTLGKALNTLNISGTTVYLRNGTYYEGDYSLSKSGATNNPITIRNYPGHHPIINGTDTAFNPRWAIHNAASNVYKTNSSAQPLHAYLNEKHLFHYLNLNDLINKKWNEPNGFYHDGTTFYVRFPDGSNPGSNNVTIPKYTQAIEMYQQSNIVIKGISFCYYGYGDFPRALYIHASSYVMVDSCDFHHTHIGVALKRNADFNTVQHCTFNESPKSQMNWDAVKSSGVDYEAGGVSVYTSNLPNQGNVYRYNTFTDMFDAMAPGSEDYAGYSSNTDIYDNFMNEIGDDGISFDGVAINIRVYNNVITNYLAGISAAPLSIGPSYIFRNLLVNSNSSGWKSNSIYTPYPFKFNVNSSFTTDWVFLYHNTSFSDIPACDGFLFKNYSNWNNIISRNNIYMGANYALNNQSNINPVSFDYDNLFTTHSSKLFYWNGTTYSSLSAFTATTSQEANALVANPTFVSIPNLDFQLSAGSPAIDKAIVVPGFNDGFNGLSPDMGKYEYGTVSDIHHTVYSKIFIYPNPSNGTFIIESKGDLEIYNLFGERKFEQKLIADKTEIALKNQARGVYYIKIIADNKIYSQKIMIQ